MDAAGKLLQVGRWNTLLSLLPIKVTELEEEPLEEEPLEEEPLEDDPEPEPPLTVLPPGSRNVAPSVEKTTVPF